MMTRTQRRWAKRMMRAGWLIAPIVAFPRKVFKFLFASAARFIGFVVCGSVLFGLVQLVRYDIKMDKVATSEQIIAALKDNACMTDLMPRRAAIDYKGRPLTMRDLTTGEADCKKAAETQVELIKQAAAMKSVKDQRK